MRLPFRIPAAAAGRFDVVGLGLNSIDLVALVGDYPPRNSKRRMDGFARMPGGQIATALTVCARLGWRAAYLGTFGGDELGRLARATLAAAGVNVDAAQTIERATNQFAVVIVDTSTGERTVLWNRHPDLTIDPAAVPRAVVESGRMLIVDCHETAAAARAAAYARAARIPTIVDVEKVRAGIDDLLRHIDAIIAAEEFPAAYTGYAEPGRALEALQGAFDAPLVCVTLGSEGSLARCGGREIRTPAFRVTCVDSTGAGDAFRGGFAAGCLRAPDGDVEDVLRYANAVAALNCRALGAQGGAPTAEEVEQLIYAKR